MSPLLFAVEAGAASPSFPVLPSLIAIPVITALVLLMMPASRADYLKLTALVGSTITGVISVYMLLQFETGDAGLQFVTRADWLPSVGLSWFLAVDGISLFLVVLTGILFPIALLTTEPHHDAKPYYIWIMLLMAGSMGAFVALDLLLFFFFFEVVLVPMYFLIGGWGHEGRVYAAMKFFLYTMAASALMLVGIASVVFLSADATGGPTFDVTELASAQALSDTAALLVFLSFALAFTLKTPAFPLHTWLPDAHTEAPTAGSVILAGVMLKLGTYGFIRFGVYLFPSVVEDLAPIFLTLGVVGIVYGAAVATMQSDLKRLVAYSSVAHMGFIVLGIFALNTQGLQGAVLQMVNHGISTGALFILVGWVYERRHTRQIAALGGLQKAAPLMAGVFTLVMLSSIGLPGLNGFVGEFLILIGTFSAARWYAVVAATGVILAALYLLWAYQRSFHGPAEGDNASMRDLRLSEFLGISPLLFLIVFLGVYPKPVLERIEPAVDELVTHVEANVDGFEEPEPIPVARAGTEELIHEAEKAHEEAKKKEEEKKKAAEEATASEEGADE
ncbi:MAG: NADH-quinone oxidoreductase subunit M [Actinomycetota bacterium]